MDESTGNIRKENGDNQAGKSCSGADIEPTARIWRERDQLNRISDMAGPNKGKGRFGNQIRCPAPAGEQVDEDGQTAFRFT